jgi:hypothetical protein
MSFISNILGGSVGKVVQEVGNVVDKFHLSGEEKQQFQLEMESLLQKRDAQVEESIRSELQAKERILVAELTQGDTYTKRARPTVVYAGLGFIFFNYCLVPVLSKIFGAMVEPLVLPPEFWYGWSGIVATYSVGRSFEKRGASNKVSRAITGSSAPRSILLDEEPAKG